MTGRPSRTGRIPGTPPGPKGARSAPAPARPRTLHVRRLILGQFITQSSRGFTPSSCGSRVGRILWRRSLNHPNLENRNEHPEVDTSFTRPSDHPRPDPRTHRRRASSCRAQRVTVKYRDLDLSTLRVLVRSTAASRGRPARCAGTRGTDFTDEAFWRGCYRGAIADAVAKVNNPMLTAVHTGHPVSVGRPAEGVSRVRAPIRALRSRGGARPREVSPCQLTA